MEAKSRSDIFHIRNPVQKYDEPKLITATVNGARVIARTKYEFEKLTTSLGQPRHIPMT